MFYKKLLISLVFILFNTTYSADHITQRKSQYTPQISFSSTNNFKIVKEEKDTEWYNQNSTSLYSTASYINLKIKGDSDMKIKVVQGNILAQKNIDALVNPANEDLQAYGGLSEKIANQTSHTHLRFDEAIRAELKEEKPQCPTGTALITTSLGFKWNNQPSFTHIIHTVGPCVKENSSLTDEQKQQLYLAHYNTFALAHDNGLNSIAIPLISTGEFGVSIQEYLPIALQAVNDYFKSRSIKELRIVTSDESIFDVFKTYIKKHVTKEEQEKMLYAYKPDEKKESELQENRSKQKPKNIFNAMMKLIKNHYYIPIGGIFGLAIIMILWVKKGYPFYQRSF